MCDTMKEGYSFYYISAAGIYASCSPVAGIGQVILGYYE